MGLDQHIAPANGQVTPPTGPNLRASAAKIGISRKYVLPPRPKPGRKPKPKDKPIKLDAASPVTPAHAASDDCGLCERDECLCQDIGIKKSPAPTPLAAPSAAASPASGPAIGVSPVRTAAELGTEITSASVASVTSVPLRRQPNPSAPKFKRASVEGMLSPVALKPTFTMKMAQGAGCGFCTDNSPCVCAEHEAKQEAEAQAAHAHAHAQATHAQAHSPHSSHSAQPHSPAPQAPQLQPTFAPPSPHTSSKDIDFGCAACQQDAMSMLFCVSLGSAQPLPAGAVAIPCTMAHRTIEKHPKFAQCDLGQIIVMLESTNKMIGVQSVNRVLQYLNDL